MNMNDYSLTQARDLIQTLRKSFPSVRLRDAENGTPICDELIVGSLEGVPFETVIIPDITLTLDVNSQTMEAPINIDGQACILEILQTRPSSPDKASLQDLKELVFLDALTNLYNRRFIDEQIPVDLKRAFRYGEPVSFIYADIDSFKKINDQCGHVVGDQVLSGTADIFQQHFRRKDGWLARYGGDEFLFCLPSINRETAVQISYRLRKAIAEQKYFYNHKSFNITCSFGVQTVDSTSKVKTVYDVIRLLDKKLYQAKKAGKNRVIS